MVATPNLFLNPFSFFGCLPVAISVATKSFFKSQVITASDNRLPFVVIDYLK